MPFIVSLFFLRKVQTAQLKAFFIYGLWLFVCNVFAFYFSEIIKAPFTVFVIVRLYEIGAFVILSWFLFSASTIISFRRTLIYLVPTAVIAIVFAYSYYYTESTFRNVPLAAMYFLSLLLILWFFFEKMKMVHATPLLVQQGFLVGIAMLIFYAGNFIFSMQKAMSSDQVVLKQILTVYCFVTITRNIILSFAWFAKEPSHDIDDRLVIPDKLHLDADVDFTLTPKNDA